MMKIFKSFMSIVLSALLVLSLTGAVTVMAEPLNIRETDFGAEHIIWEENFNSKSALADYLTSSDGYTIGEGTNSVQTSAGVKLVSRGTGDYAIQIGSTSVGTHFWLQKDFDKTWNQILAEGDITPSAGDYIVFSVDVCYNGNAWIFRSDYIGNSAKNLGLFTGTSKKFATGSGSEFFDVTNNNWYNISVVYKYDSSALKYATTVVNDTVYKLEANKYYDIPLEGLSFVQMRANWSNTKIDNIKISYVKNEDLTALVKSEVINPYNTIDIEFNRKAISGFVSLKAGDTVIESDGAVSGKRLTLNSAQCLEFGKEYKIELKNIKDIYGKTIADKTIMLKTVEKTNIPSTEVSLSDLKNISVVLPMEPDASDLSDVKLCYSDASGTPREFAVSNASTSVDENGTVTLNVPIDQNLRAATTYRVTMNNDELVSFTTKDGVNVTRPDFEVNSGNITAITNGIITATVKVDNETGFANIDSAQLLLMYFEGDRLVKISCGNPVSIGAVQTEVSADIDLGSVTLKPDSRLKTFVVNSFRGMFPLIGSAILE